MWTLIMALLIAITIAGFASLNGAPVSVNFFFFKAPEISLALVVLFSVLLGVILALVFTIPVYIKSVRKSKEIEETKNEKENSQAPPQN